MVVELYVFFGIIISAICFVIGLCSLGDRDAFFGKSLAAIVAIWVTLFLLHQRTEESKVKEPIHDINGNKYVMMNGKPRQIFFTQQIDENAVEKTKYHSYYKFLGVRESEEVTDSRIRISE